MSNASLMSPPSPAPPPNGPYPSDTPVGPKLDPETLEQTNLEVKDAIQAWNICRSVEWATRAQIKTAAAIRRVIDGAPPLSVESLRQAGNAWQSNVNTGFLDTVLQKVYPKLYMRIKSCMYLTAAALPDDWPGAVEKTEIFRRITTKAIRAWPGWNIFLQGLCKEVCQTGYAFPVWPDKTDWKPKMYRVDECFIPQGTPILFQDMQYFPFRTDWDVFDLINRIIPFPDNIEASRKMAEQAGWEVDACVAAINSARPKSRATTGLETDVLRYQDLIRERIPVSSYQKAWNVVQTYTLNYKEKDGEISTWILEYYTGACLYYNKSKMWRMEDLIVPTVFQYGTGKVYSSSGVGQLLYNQQAQIERSRNRAWDNLAMAGKPLFKVADADNLDRLKLTVQTTATAFTGGDYVQTPSLNGNTQAYMELDERWGQIADQRVGAFMPVAMQGSDTQTATAAQINALKEGETANVNLDNFLTQMQMITGVITRRMFSPFVRSKEAMLAKAALQKAGLTSLEVNMLAFEPPSENLVDFGGEQEKKLEAALMAIISNPQAAQVFDQTKAAIMLMQLQIGPQKTATLTLNPTGPTMQAQNTSKQLFENPLLASGQSMPIAPNDADEVHMGIIQGQQDPQTGQWQNPITQALSQGNIAGASALLQHYAGHIQNGQRKNELGLPENNYKQFLAQMEKLVMVATQQVQHAQATAAAQAGLIHPSQIPPPPQPPPAPQPPTLAQQV